jgi:hypothetical protein
MLDTMTVPNAGAAGLIADLTPSSLPMEALSYTKNIRIDDGAIKSFLGYGSIDTVSNPPETIELVFSGGKSFITFGYSDGVYSWESGTESTISHRTFAGSGIWDSCMLGNVAIYNKTTDAPCYWGGAGTTVDMPYNTDEGCTWKSQGMLAEVIRSFKGHLFALNITNCNGHDPQGVHWSDPAGPNELPTTWDPADATNDAGITTLADTAGEIIDGLALHDSFLIYKSDAIYSATKTFDTFVFNFRLLTTDKGLFAKKCVCDVGGKHFFISNSEFYITDGTEFAPVGDNKVKNLFFSEVKKQYYTNTFVAYKESTDEVWVCYPNESQYPNKALVFNLSSGSWYSCSLPNARCAAFGVLDKTSPYTWATLPYATWADWNTTPPAPVWPYWDSVIGTNPRYEALIMGSDSKLIEMDLGNQEDGANRECIARRTDLDVDTDRSGTTQVLNIYIDAEGDAFNVRIGKQSVNGGAVAWSDYKEFTPGTTRKLDFRINGNLHAIEFQSDANVAWAINSYQLVYSPSGRRV